MLLIPQIGLADQKEQAIRSALNAAYYQSGLNKDIKVFGKKIQKRYISKDVLLWTNILYQLGRVANEKKINYSWSF